MFEHQVPNKEVGPPFRGRSVPHGTLPSKLWTVSNWMFTLLLWRGKALRDEGGGNPLRTLHSRTFHKSPVLFRSADWGSDGSHLTSTWWSPLNVSLGVSANSIISQCGIGPGEESWHRREPPGPLRDLTSLSFYITVQGGIITAVRLPTIERII